MRQMCEQPHPVNLYVSRQFFVSNARTVIDNLLMLLIGVKLNSDDWRGRHQPRFVWKRAKEHDLPKESQSVKIAGENQL
jgi:hypothetical protein